MFRLGYNTNGLAHHRVLDALQLLADLGYEAVALTPDVGQLDLFDLHPRQVERVRKASEELGLELAVETGARFLLDARRKHYPTLLEEDEHARARRVDFLRRSLHLAHELGAGVLSLWSGKAPDGLRAEGAPLHDERAERHWQHLVDGLKPILEEASEREIRVVFEPEPGMFVERPLGYSALIERLGRHGDGLGLCLDVGHLLVTGDLPVGAQIRALASRLEHVHLDDIRSGLHEHRMFGSGDLDLVETLGALLEVGFSGMAAVELSRDSHRGASAAAEAFDHLRNALARLKS